MSSKGEIHQFYDKTYAKLFSHQQVVSDFIKGFIKDDFARDIEVLEQLETTFITKKYKKYESDVVYKARLKDKDLYIFILIEFQTKNDHLIALRLMNYISLFYLHQVKQENIKPPFPPILPVVIHIGDDNFTKYRNFNQLINIPYKSIKKYIPNFKYFLLDLNTFPKRTLARMAIHSKNIASLLFEIDKYNESDLSKNFNKIIDLIRKNCSNEILLDFQEYLASIISDDKKEEQEMIRTLNKEPSMLYNTIQSMKKKIKKEGRIEGRVEVVLEMQKNGLPLEMIAKYTSMTVEKLQKLLKDNG